MLKGGVRVRPQAEPWLGTCRVPLVSVIQVIRSVLRHIWFKLDCLSEMLVIRLPVYVTCEYSFKKTDIKFYPKLFCYSLEQISYNFNSINESRP